MVGTNATRRPARAASAETARMSAIEVMERTREGYQGASPEAIGGAVPVLRGHASRRRASHTGALCRATLHLPAMRRYAISAALLSVFALRSAGAQSVRLAERLEDLEARARQDSCDAAAQYNVAVGYVSRSRFDQADSALQRAVALDPQFAQAYFALGLVQDRNDRFWNQLKRTGGDSAVVREVRRREAFERKAFLIDPFVDVRLLGSVMRRGYVSTGASDALEQMAAGNYQRAYEQFDGVLRYFMNRGGLDSANTMLLWLHALSAARAEHYPEALADVDALLRVSLAAERDDSSHVVPLRTNEYRYMRAALLQRMGNRPEAARLYQEVITNDLGNYMAHVQLARLYEAERRWDQAIAERRSATDVNPDDHTLMFDLGATQARAAQWQNAEESLLRAKSMEPRYPRTWHALGVVQQQLGKSADARASLNQFLAIAPARYSTQISDARQRLAQLP